MPLPKPQKSKQTAPAPNSIPNRNAVPEKKEADSKRAASTTKTANSGASQSEAKKPLKLSGRGRTLSSKTVYRGKVFWVTHDEVAEPGGVKARRDVVRHNGSVVILAVDSSTNPADPDILLIRQYRHAAEKFLLELPAGRLEPGEKLMAAGKRELIEETGYRARRWSRHVSYFASPGFVSEAMTILIAEDLTPGDAAPEEDEKIEIHMTPLSEVLRLIQAGKIEDGKTLIGVLYFHSFSRPS